MSESPVSLELSEQIREWRRKAAINELTQDEMRAAIIHLRAGRVSAQAASAAGKRKTAIKAIPSAADMLDEIDNI